MSLGVSRVLLVSAACLVVLTGCETSTRFSDLFGSSNTSQTAGEPDSTGSISSVSSASAPEPIPESGPPISSLVGSDPGSDVVLGKKQYRAGNYGTAERHFRRAVETSPRDLESWLGLAACYDRLKRFDLADRAYDQAIRLAGPTPGILNNQGYSYILRNDFKRAREKLLAAQAKDPNNPYIQNNMALLEESRRTGKTPQ